MSHASTSSQLAIAGGFGGLMECLSVQPFDMVKTRFQLSERPNPSIWSSLRGLIAEGGFLRLYRGILPEAAGMVPKSSLMYASNELAKRKLTEWNGGETTTAVAFAAGWLSGYPEAISVTPFQVIKVRLQAKEHLGRYKNSADCLRQLLRHEGITALGIGLPTTCWRNCVWNAIYFGLMHAIKDQLPKSDSHWIELTISLVTGSIGGVVATFFNVPFDMVKSRIQSQLPVKLNGGVPLKYRNTFQSLMLVYQEEGYRALFKGLAPKCARMAIGGGVCMAAFEAACMVMNKLNNDDDDD